MHTEPPLKFGHPSFRGGIGIARTDITPPVGIYARNWGAAKHDLADAIHCPLTLNALTLTSAAGGPPQVFVDADLGWWKTPATFHKFFARLRETLGLDSSRLLFSLTHTHSGPPLMEGDESLPGNELLRDWLEDLFEKTVQTIGKSIESQSDSILDWHVGRCSLAKNRDLPDPDPDNSRLICGFNPAGNPDDTLLVGRVSDLNGKIRATLTNYACHPTTLAWENSSISPDYIGAMRQTMERETGVPALFMLGACGDLAPRYQYVKDPGVADRHGKQLGYAGLATLQDMEPAGTDLAYSETVESGAPLAVWKPESRDSPTRLTAIEKMVELPIKNWPSAEELDEQRLACNDRALEERLRRKRDIRLGLGDGSTFQLPIYVWRFGDIVLVGSCCEPYSILQQELRRRFSGHTIVVMNLINGSIGYLPPAELYDTEVYPVWQTPFDRGSLESTLASMTEAIQDVLTD